MSIVSPFYQEILLFLKTRSGMLRRVDAFHQVVDLDVQKLHDLIDAALRGESGSWVLEEIIEYYQQLFEAREEVNPERQWMRAFPMQEFADARLGAYLPKIYRGLPRLYDRDDPGRSKIKGNFTNLADLKRRSIDRALFSLYDRVPLPRAMRVSIFAWVMPGLGDWVAVQECAALLKERIPHIDVQLWFLTSRELPRCDAFPTHEIRYEKEPSISDFSAEDLSALRKSHLILQIPTFFKQTHALLEAIQAVSSEQPMPVVEAIGEYGFLESGWFHPKTAHYSMGLHALEKGIFIRKPIHCNFSEIEHKPLLEQLFGTQTPGPHEIEFYETHRRFYMAYLVTPIGGAIYLHSLLKMLAKDRKDVDLCCPDMDWLIQWIEERKRLNLPFLEECFGVKEVSIFAFNECHRMTLGDAGKTIRILCPNSLSHADMQKLFFLSGDWIGVRGNQSISEAISYGKPFFLDALDHTRYFIKDLVAFAENRLGAHRSALQAFRMMGQAFLWNLPEQRGDWVEESHFQRNERMPWFEIAVELAHCLEDPDAIVGYKKLCSAIALEHSFNPFLLHLVQRDLFHVLHPAIRDLEMHELNLYLSGKQSFSSFIKNHREHIMRAKR